MLRTTDPKDIGIMYLVTVVRRSSWSAALMALLMRAELARPGQQFLSTEQYNQLFTMHGTIMLLLFATPILFGFANYIVPLQIGAPDVAFPRLNAFSYWLYLFGGADRACPASSPRAARPTSAGSPTRRCRTSATRPASAPTCGSSAWSSPVWARSSAAVNIITTIICLRAPGMTMFRMPIFTWNILVTAFLILLAFPVLTAALFGLAADRHLGAHVFDPANGGRDPVAAPVLVLRPPRGLHRRAAVLRHHHRDHPGLQPQAAVRLQGHGRSPPSRSPRCRSAVWAHHMFATGAVLLPFFSLLTLPDRGADRHEVLQLDRHDVARPAHASRRRCCSRSASWSRSCSAA